jgi:hypothetical protein
MKKNYWLLMVAFLLVSCQNGAKTGTAGPPGENARANVITPGTYTICQEDAAESGHDDVVGPHLSGSDLVVIKPFGKHATKVCLKKDCPAPGSDPPESEVKVLWMAGDNHKLGTDTTFEHKTENGETVRRPHFVMIENKADDQGESGLCTKPQVLTVSFCTPSANGEEITCIQPETHLGHVHVQN